MAAPESAEALLTPAAARAPRSVRTPRRASSAPGSLSASPLVMIAAPAHRALVEERLTAAGHVIDPTLASSESDGVRVYGETIDLLWKGNQPMAAIELEQMRTPLQSIHRFGSLCSYWIGGLRGPSAALRRVCSLQAHMSLDRGRFEPRHRTGAGPRAARARS
jgi:hypothetical protein